MAGEVKGTDMSELFESITRGMEEAIAHSRARTQNYFILVPEKEYEKRVSEQ